MPDDQEFVTGIAGSTQASEVPQFATAEYSHIPGTERCRFCNNLISGEYFRVNNQMACSKCGAEANDGQPKDSHSAFVRGILWGMGGAVLGLLLYSLVGILTGFTIGYLALAVGFVVAKAMMIGSNGMGGIRYQIVAIALTYAAISISAVPIGIAYQLKHRPNSHVRQSATPPAESDANATPAPSGSDAQQESAPAPRHRVGLGAAILRLFLVGLASPFLELENPVHGLIGLVILFVGLSIAFRMTAAKPLNIDGPYPVNG